MKKIILLSLLLFGMFLSIRAWAEPAAYLTNTHVDLKNRLIFGELAYDAPDLCARYALGFTTRVYRAGAWVDSARVKFTAASGTILSNTDRYTLINDSAMTDVTVGGLTLKATLPSGVLPTDSVALAVEVYRLADKCLGCGVGGSATTFTRKDIWQDCPYPNKDSDPTLLACSRASTGAGARWEAFVRDGRDCNIYRTVYMDGVEQWWLGQNLRWRQAGKCYPTEASCDTVGRLYSWFEAMTGVYDDGAATRYPSLVYELVGPQGVCPPGWHLPTDVEWGQLGYGAGSLANTYDPWQGEAVAKLASFSGFGVQAGLRSATDRHGFGWSATPFEAQRGIGGGSIRFGAYWSALRPGLDAGTDSVNRVAAVAVNGAWTATPLAADSNRGVKRDYLPVRCLYGAGSAPGPIVSVATPVLGMTSHSCSGDTVTQVSNMAAFNSLTFYVDGAAAQQGGNPYLVISNGPGVTEQQYQLWAKGSNALGYFSQPSAAQSVTITQTLHGEVGVPPGCTPVSPGFIGVGY
ncbi:MAG: hypothetical protein LBK47_07570 [Prevotellaceae bacterium]|jgi:uncharacterized protein (TIGR02145 family)|nr:hypothetical protein [Prevotellaceae bacterium]